MNLFTYDNTEIRFYEPRSSSDNTLAAFLSLYTKKVIMACIGLFLLVEILYKSILQLDTLKLQS